jgi:hypothetical protein
MPQGIYKPIALLGYTSPVITALVPQVRNQRPPPPPIPTKPDCLTWPLHRSHHQNKTFVVGAAGSRNFRVEVETVLLVPSGTGGRALLFWHLNQT